MIKASVTVLFSSVICIWGKRSSHQMNRRDILKRQREAILKRIRSRGDGAQRSIPGTRAAQINVISNTDLKPLDGWPTIFDLSLLPPSPTDVQRFSIPYVLGKESISVVSETGSGKTLSYILPYIYILENEDKRLLVVVPTRELVLQVAQLFRRFSSNSVKTVEVTGGRSIDLQRLELSGAFSVVVSTPGRMRELMELRCVGSFDYVVVDEVDRLLSFNFRDDMDFILRCSDAEVCSYFSATLFSCPTKTRILVGDVGVNKNVKEDFLYSEKVKKMEVLKNVLETSQDRCGSHENRDSVESMEGVGKVIIFCNTIKMCEAIHRELRSSLILHSKMDMAERESVVEKMHAGEGVMVTTDLAGRGVDIRDVDLVVNYDFPDSIETYIHRCGRTGRQRSGRALSILCEDDRRMFKKLRRLIENRHGQVPWFLCTKEDVIMD